MRETCSDAHYSCRHHNICYTFNNKQKQNRMARKQTVKQKRALHRRIIQFAEYMVSGGVYFWTGYGAFFVFWSLLHWSLLSSKILADIVGWTVNYLLQRFWVFSNHTLGEHQIQVTVRYAVI